MPAPRKPLIEMKDIHVYYDDVHALKGVDFNLFPGEIHGLVGEHRAGKSSLVNFLCGTVQKTQGTLLFKNKRIEKLTALNAKKLGISIIFQNLTIIPSLNSIENIFLGHPIFGAWGFVKKKEMEQIAVRILARLGSSFNVKIPLTKLSEKNKHIVELAKALSTNPEILIFDEISSKFTPEEMETVYTIIQDFKASGKSVIYITHNLDEIFRLTDRVTIMKGGSRCGTEEIRDLDKIKLIKMTYTFVRTRQDLEEDNQNLFLLKQFYESIMDNLPVGLLIMDTDHRITASNRAARLVIGNADYQQLSLIDWIKSQGWREQEGILECIESKTSGNWDHLVISGNRTLSLKSIPFHNDDFKFIGTIFIMEDRTQQNNLNDYFIRTEKIASVAELAAGVAHEVNNPLGIVLNYVNLLKRSIGGKEELASLGKIEREILRISEITRSLLSFSRGATNPAEVNMKSLIEETLILLSHPLKKKCIRLDSILPEGSVVVLGFENQIKQVLLNLCINAIEAVLENGRITITLIKDPEGNYCQLAVEDDGCGIPPGLEKKIFDPFFTTKAGKANSGLGLSVSQNIVEAHGGMIYCESYPGRTKMIVRIPIALSMD